MNVDKTAFLLLIFFSILIFSCQTLSVENRFNNLTDSDKNELAKELKIMAKNDQLHRSRIVKLPKDSKDYSSKSDSLWKIQKKIDSANTERLIEITKNIGFPNTKRIKPSVAAWLIFQHSPKKYSKELKILLKKEYKAGRLPDLEYNMIVWHLNGREGPLPFTIVEE